MTQRWGWTHRYAVPMFAASVVAVLLAGTAAVALLVSDGAGDDGGDGGTGPGAGVGPGGGPGLGGGSGPPVPPPTGAAGIDPCVVGTWQVVAQTEPLPTEAGTMALDGPGAVFEFRADGTGSGDYGDATTFDADALGQEMVLTVTGTLTFRFQAAGGTFQFVEIDSEATFSFDVLAIEEGYSLSQEPVSYRCEGADTLHFENQEGYAAEYQRRAA